MQSSITDRAVGLAVEFHLPGIRRRLDKDSVEVDMDKTLLQANKTIIDSDTYQEIHNGYIALREFLRRKTLPSPFIRRGVYFVPIELIEQVDAKIEDTKANTARLAKQFAREYPDLIKEAKRRLRREFDADNYLPTSRIARAFGITTRYVEFNTPGALKSVSMELHRRELAKVRESVADATREIQTLLREQFAAVVERLAGKLTDEKPGERKKFHDSMIKKADEFMEDFKARNIVDDKSLAALVERARKVLKGVTGDQLRYNDQLRERTAAAFTAIQDKLSGMITEGPRRRIRIAETTERQAA